jgi:NADH:ubiquinone oxidoreductase subunit D
MNHFMLVMDGFGIRPPAGEAYMPVEGANGELGFYVVSDGSDRRIACAAARRACRRWRRCRA